MDSVMTIEPLATKLKAFGASVDSIDGHDTAALAHSLERPTGKPHFVLAYTDPTRGVPLMNERRPVLHYLRFTGDDERALSGLLRRTPNCHRDGKQGAHR
jgi:transketolase